MCSWRLLKLETQCAFANMAIDEALLRVRIDGKTPNTLRVYQWLPSAVSIGRFQSISREVNLESCRVHGVDVVRRISGGGAVYHDSKGEITYSVVVKQDDLGTNDIVQVYNCICNGLIEAAHLLGVNAEFASGNARRCPNIIVKGRKISGSAQASRRGVILQHGTFLMNVNLREMFAFLNDPWRDAGVDVVDLAKTKITSVTDETQSVVSPNQVYEALVEGFERRLQVRLVEMGLTDYELDLARRLEEEKFATRQWNIDGKARRLGLKPVG